MSQSPVRVADDAAWSDEELVRRCRARDEAAVRILTRRYNQRLYRIARSILRDDAEAEDVVQEAYVRAFTNLDGFRDEAGFGTWIVRIAMNEALGRLRRRRPMVDWAEHGEDRVQAEIIQFPAASASQNPERTMAQNQLRSLLERAIDNLPESFRTVFVARMVEGLSVEETSDLLGLPAATVKTRVHRARRRLQVELEKQAGPLVSSAFSFDGARCDRLTDAVVRRLGLSA